MSGRKTEHTPIDGIDNSNRVEMENLLLTRTMTTSTVVATRNKNDILNVSGTRDNWSNRVVYLLSIIGFVVDLGK